MMKYIVVVIVLLCSCAQEKTYSPKPRMYPKVEYPTKEMMDISLEYCDFSFRAPAYMDVVQEQYFFDGKIVHPCWFDLAVPSLRAKLHCSYYPLENRDQLDKLVYDAFQVTNEHNKKANYIDEKLIEKPSDNVHGLLFNVDGPVASPIQFYLTDSTNHFFRAALYFNSRVDADSTAPIVEFLVTDIDSLISSWEWVK